MIDYDTKVFRHHTAMAVDQIDAAIFSGDEFTKLQPRVALRKLIRRWEKQLQELSDDEMREHGLPAEGDSAKGDDREGDSAGKIVLG